MDRASYGQPGPPTRAKRPGKGAAVAVSRCGYSPSVSRLALPPAAVVFTVTVFSVAKRGR